MRAVDACTSAERPWIAFEYVVGTSLAEMLRRTGPLEPALALHLGHEMALGLAAAHQQGLCHGDLKPANVMVTPSGSVKLIDFGAAHGDETTERTDGTLLPCTRTYASPEQLQGKVLDERADLYALGLILYEILTGRRVMEVSSRPRMIFAQTRIPESLSRPGELRPCLGSAVDELVFGLLAFRPDERLPRSAAELAIALEGLVAHLEADSPHRKERRETARRELAETDYWKGRNLVDRKRLGEGLSIWRSLVDLPTESGRPYRERIREDLSDLLLRLPMRDPCPGETGPRQEALDGLVAMTRVARSLGDKDLLLRMERRAVTLLAAEADGDVALRELTRFLRLVPWSHALATAIHGRAVSADRPKTITAIRLPLARILLECRDHARATALAMDELRSDGRRAEATTILKAAADRSRELGAARRSFETISSLFIARQHFAEGANACRKHLRDHPWDASAWERLADLCLALEEEEEALGALTTTARIAFTRGQLDEARRLWVRLLRLRPDHAPAFAFLLETLAALDALPVSARGGRRRRLAVFCQEGIALADTARLDEELDGTLEDVPLLEELLPIAREAGNRELEAAVLLRLAAFALGGGLREEAREYYVQALEASLEPVSLLEAIGRLDVSPPVFAPMEILRLRRRLAGEDTASMRRTTRRREALDERLHREQALHLALARNDAS